MDAIRIQKIRIGHGIARCYLELAVDTPRYTNPDLIASVVRDHPDLPRHACVNSVGPLFGDVIDRTSIPHLFEHLVIDQQVADEPEGLDRQVTYTGTTEWLDEERGLALVCVSFRDDLCVLRAMGDTAAYLNALISQK